MASNTKVERKQKAAAAFLTQHISTCAVGKEAGKRKGASRASILQPLRDTIRLTEGICVHNDRGLVQGLQGAKLDRVQKKVTKRARACGVTQLHTKRGAAGVRVSVGLCMLCGG